MTYYDTGQCERSIGEKKPFENVVGTEKMPVTNIFSFAYNVFHSIKEKVHYLSKTEIVVCKYFQF